MEEVAQDQVPGGNVKQAQAHHGEAHDRTGGKGHPQSGVQALPAGVGGAGIGRSGDFHAHIAAEAGEEAAGDEGKGNEPGQKAEGCHGAQHAEHAAEEDDDHGVLPVQVGFCAGADEGSDLLHKVGSLVNGQGALCHQDGKDQRADGTQGCENDEQLAHFLFLHSVLVPKKNGNFPLFSPEHWSKKRTKIPPGEHALFFALPKPYFYLNPCMPTGSAANRYIGIYLTIVNSAKPLNSNFQFCPIVPISMYFLFPSEAGFTPGPGQR